MRERRYDIDWLRVAAMLAIFVFHCTRLFDTEGWHVKNPQQSEGLFIAMRAAVWPWAMGLFILLPPQFYLDLLSHGGFGGTFWESLPRYWAGFKPPQLIQRPDTLLPIPFSGHLWFLQYLYPDFPAELAALHQTVILAVGFFVIRWDGGIPFKLLAATVIAFPLTLGLYELMIRRFNPVRFLCGMRPGKSVPKPATASHRP